MMDDLGSLIKFGLYIFAQFPSLIYKIVVMVDLGSIMKFGLYICRVLLSVTRLCFLFLFRPQDRSMISFDFSCGISALFIEMSKKL